MKIEMKIKLWLRAGATWITSYDKEIKCITSFIDRFGCREPRILDVGCGFGRNLKALRDSGFMHVIGVEKNLQTVKFVRQKGYVCFNLDEFAKSNERFDVILMSHIIEHFSPSSLLDFIDTYLDRLEPGGILIISTPVMGNLFYDDFDHIKPYMPTGILHVFGRSASQVQFLSRNKIELTDLWFRRGFYKLTLYRASYIKSPLTLLIRLINVLSALIFRASFGLFGQVDGWVGVFKKCR
jgi:SAM-dependent methyltransferase